MKKGLLCLAIVASSISIASAQVGVNTETPQATLDVVGSPSDASKYDGIIAPRISGNDLNTKTYTTAQTGALVYVTSPVASPAGQTIDVTSVGYYYFNGDASINKWIKLSTGAAAATEPWNIQGSTNPATANTQNIYQQGKVSIGSSATTAVTSKQLEVVGDLKAQNEVSGKYIGIETNFATFGVPMNIMYVANNADLASATESSIVNVRDGIANIQATGTGGGASLATFGNTSGGNFGLVASNTNTDVVSALWGYADAAANNLTLYSQKTSAEGTLVTLEKTNGVTFQFSKPDQSTEGIYTFPRNNGSANQLLVTAGTTPSTQLNWKSISAIPQNIRTLGSGTVADDDYTVLVTGNISLPAASASNIGKIYNLIKDTTSDVTISGTFRMNGADVSDYTLQVNPINRFGVTVQSTGSAWIVISRY